MKKRLKLALFAIAVLAAGVTNAQQTSGDVTTNNKDVQTGLNKTVRVIDNKGTIKYLQTKNGITTITNTTNDRTTTTWQLGGELDNDTYINAAGITFSLDGLKLASATSGTSTNFAASATSQSVGSNAVTISGTGTASTDTGFTILVRDEASGEIQKMLFSDFLEVQSAHSEVTIDATNTTTVTDSSTSAAGIEITIETSRTNVQVYRNGAKLRALRDYNIKTVSGSPDRYFVYLIPQPASAAPNDWELYNGDIIEVHAIK